VTHFPYEVTSNDNAHQVGDEPLLIAQKTVCPVVISPKRVEAVQYLLDKHHSEIIISDDGLQHYAMGRAIEIVVIDGQRGFGNGLCLPAGPMRETVSRLKKVDFILVNGSAPQPIFADTYRMDLVPGAITGLLSGQSVSVFDLEEPIAAVAAIGNPQRFFALLARLGVRFKPYSFPDHHPFHAADLCLREKTVVMTEKDAVKCIPFASESMYCLPVEAQVEDKFWDTLWLHKGLQMDA
jgi:tetraacyldisaccharide 4'-kinase